MGNQQVAVTVILALVASGVWPFLQAFLKRKPEVKQLDAQTTSITVQGAETTVTVLMRSLERAEARELLLETRLTDREAKIDELESRLDAMQLTVATLQSELNDARRQLAQLHEG